MLPPELLTISLSIPQIVAQPGAVPIYATADWTNNLGYTIGVPHILIWIGQSGQSITDTPFSLRNVTRNINWFGLGWDHYGNPVSINGNVLQVSYPQGARYVNPGEQIEFKVGMVNYNPTIAYGSAGATLSYLTP